MPEEWVDDVLRAEPLEADLAGALGERFLRNWIASASRWEPDFESLPNEVLEQFTFRLAFSLGEAIWDDNLEFHLRERALNCVSQYLVATCTKLHRSPAAFGFWETLLMPWVVQHQRASSHPLIPVVREVVLSQLAHSSVVCGRLSALHAVNHLQDVSLARRARELQDDFDPETVAYAERAFAFEAP